MSRPDPPRALRLELLGYAVALAGFAWLLEWMEYRWRVRRLSGEIWVALVAIIFTGLGIWLGRKLTVRPISPSPVGNPRAVRSLGITDRELELLALLAEGCSNKEIARRSQISINTVKTHLSSLYGKLDASRRTQAVARARELGILS